jgi:alkyldihydroxyacetonephosphate synthase
LGEDNVNEDPLRRAQLSLGQSYGDQLARRSGRIARLCDAVVVPADQDAVVALVELAQTHGLRLTPVSGATNVVGAIDGAGVDAKPWIVVDLSSLNAIRNISERDLAASVEAGVMLAELERRLGERSLTLGHFPQSFARASLGGSIMANGAGQASDGYGRMSDMLIAAKLATPRGLWRTERFRHAAAGPWLGGLVAGSEGLFGILVEADIRVTHAPEIVEDRAFALPSFAAGLEAMRALAQSGVGLSMKRLSDERETDFYGQLRLRRKGLDAPPQFERVAARLLRVPPRPALLIASYEGPRARLRTTFSEAHRILAHAGAIGLGAAPGRSWRRDRFTAPIWREGLLAHGAGVETFETAARWSELPALHATVTTAISNAIAETAGAHGVVFAHVSHSYPEGASLYFTALFPQSDDPVGQWRLIKKRAADAIVAAGGTVSHHHGLGADHAPWAQAEKGGLGLSALRALKGAFDPQGVMATGAELAL